jgi:tRNA pseudouridine38-40 synthase
VRLRLLIEYDGTDFAGFQFQGKGERTVQGSLEQAIARIGGGDVRVHGAGRTDAGVHASGQVVHFDTNWTIPVDRVSVAITPQLPRDLVVKTVELAPAEFHSRFDATRRTYRYAILNRAAKSALLGRFAHHERQSLDVGAMQVAALELVGTHDFAAFGSPSKPGAGTVRRIERIAVRPWRESILITVVGNAFLRQQVRAIVGTLLEVGRRKLDSGGVREIRDSRERASCPAVAPARGLCLTRVDYDGIRYAEDTRHEDFFGKAE